MKMAKFGYLALCHVKSLSSPEDALNPYKKRYRSCGKIDWIVLDVAPNITDKHASTESVSVLSET
jgi:hypothetical protein